MEPQRDNPGTDRTAAGRPEVDDEPRKRDQQRGRVARLLEAQRKRRLSVERVLQAQRERNLRHGR